METVHDRSVRFTGHVVLHPSLLSEGIKYLWIVVTFETDYETLQ